MGIYADGTATGRKLYYGGIKIRKMALGNRKVYSSGNMATYHVDTGISYTEEVESCLSPGTFTPEKEGWEFAGWRQDAAADGEVLGSLVMGDAPVELYAVFRQEVVLETVANGTTEREIKARLYNNGNMANPMFTVASPSKAGATFKGWSSGAGSTAITNAAITNLKLDASTTRWAVFEYANYEIVPNPKYDQASDTISGFCNSFSSTSTPGRPYVWAKGIWGYLGVPCGYPVDIFSGQMAVDFSKYAAATIYGSRFIKVNFKDSWGILSLNGGGSTKELLRGSDISSSDPVYFAWGATSGTGLLTLTFTLNPGSSSTTQQEFRISKIILHGRVTVG